MMAHSSKAVLLLESTVIPSSLALVREGASISMPSGIITADISISEATAITFLFPMTVTQTLSSGALAMAMESRCYHGGEGRTRLNVLKFKKGDAVALLAFMLLTAAVIAAGRLLP